MSRLSFADLETRKFAPACLAAMRPAVDAAPLRAGDRDELCIGAVLLTHSLDQALQVISASAPRARDAPARSRRTGDWDPDAVESMRTGLVRVER